MSAYEHSSSPVRRDPTLRTATGIIARLLQHAILNWQRNRAAVALQQLDDRLLEDIGIIRNDIPRIVEGLFGPPEQV
ncbi:DUF1127 domain-containing protein [Sinorhizobium meliloti]|nr:DUF1127 domain-containing protein [Sinorhizobium meliloti]